MPRRGATVTQADVARAIRGARAAGMHVRRMVVKTDGVELELGDGPAPKPVEHQEGQHNDSVRPEMIL